MTPIGLRLEGHDDGRHVMSMPCEGEWVVCAVDRTGSGTGLLIVSGGNEIATGSQRSMARLAGLIADQGWSVIRFDRRGVGDSGGMNGGYASAGPDLEAAQRCAAHIGVRRLVAFGNCDGATALATLPLGTGPMSSPSSPAPIVARLLGNPWLADRGEGLPAPAAIRDRYRRRLADPAAWRALLAGRISAAGIARGLRRMADERTPDDRFTDICAGLRRTPLPTRLVLANADATGIAFRDAWVRRAPRDLHEAVRTHIVNTASHGFTRDADLRQLSALLVDMLRAADAPG